MHWVRCGGCGVGHRRDTSRYQLPTCFLQHDDRDLAMGQVLLMSDVSVCRNEYIESGCFRGVQQFAVLQRVTAFGRLLPTVRPSISLAARHRLAVVIAVPSSTLELTGASA